MIEVLSEARKVVARKKHICSYCYGPIEKGEPYTTATLKYDEVYRWKEHIACAELVQKLNMFDWVYEEGLTAEDFQENITNTYVEILKEQGKYDYDKREYQQLPEFQERLKLVKEIVLIEV